MFYTECNYGLPLSLDMQSYQEVRHMSLGTVGAMAVTITLPSGFFYRHHGRTVTADFAMFGYNFIGFSEKYIFVSSRRIKITQIGFLFSGKVQIIQEDFWGNRTIFGANRYRRNVWGSLCLCRNTADSCNSSGSRRRTALLIFLIKSYCLYVPTPALFTVS